MSVVGLSDLVVSACRFLGRFCEGLYDYFLKDVLFRLQSFCQKLRKPKKTKKGKNGAGEKIRLQNGGGSEKSNCKIIRLEKTLCEVLGLEQNRIATLLALRKI